MRRTLLAILTILSLAAAGAYAGWADFAKGLVNATAGTDRANKKSSGANAAVRGLGEDDDKSAKSNDPEDKREYGQLDRLDKKMPSSADVEKFVKEGKLEN